MSATSIKPPFEQFNDANGKPLEAGYIYIGTANLPPETNPISVYWDSALSILASQPIRTVGGYPSRGGTPAMVYSDTDYSIMVKDKNGSIVYNAASILERIPGVGAVVNSIAALRLVSKVLYSTTLVLGYYTKGDDGGGEFYYDSTDTTSADNGGTIIVASDGGRWKRVIEGQISVRMFGAVGDGVTDDTAAIQTAINTGESLYLPAGSYLANNLTQTTAGQCFYGDGDAYIQKNADGDLFTSSGDYVTISGIAFRGESATPAFTGRNVYSTGNHFSLIDAGSYWAHGRAVLATGAHTQIIGTNTLYQSTDATATGYDIELGVSGTATLYHHISGVYTGQNEGGIKLVDCGAATIIGSQFGKYTDSSGTSPAGSGANKVIGNRIIGDISVGISNSIIAGNAVAGNVAYLSGTSGCIFDVTNITAGSSTFSNAGNANNTIIRNASSGGTVRLGFGTTNAAYIDLNTTSGDTKMAGSFGIPNNKNITGRNAANDADLAIANINASNNITFGNYTSVTNSLVAGTILSFNVNSATQCQAVDGTFRPGADGTKYLGSASYRWNTVYATTGTINTSDEREKQQIAKLTEAEKRVAVKCKSLIRSFKFNDAVKSKGDNARIHIGVIAQDVMKAFESEGLDAFKYSILCFDEWDARDEVTEVIPATDTEPEKTIVVQHAMEAGNRYGVRYEELLAFIISVM
jgi:hypothetical protein